MATTRLRSGIVLAAIVTIVTALSFSVSATPLRPEPTPGGRAVPHAISFKTPIDFATGAEPSSAAFNAAAGDQSYLLGFRATLSDGLAVGDFNRDGKRDVAQTNVIAGTVSVFLGNGRGSFARPRQHRVGGSPGFIAARDLDLDNDLDLVVANFASDGVTVLRGDGNGGFLPASFVPVPFPRNVAIGNFNGDGVPDLAVASGAPANIDKPSTGGVMILAGSESRDARFDPIQFIATTQNDRSVGANYVAMGDFNGGGDDLAVAVGVRPNAGDEQPGSKERTGDDTLIFLNRDDASGGQPFNSAPEQRIRVGGLPSAIAVADLNGDARRDLAVVSNASDDVTTLLGGRKGAFVVKDRAAVGGISRAVAIGDFNDDGVPDLVTANFNGSTVSVLQGRGDGTLRPAVDFWAGDSATGVAVGQFDRDGRLDVIVARLRTDKLSLLRNDSPKRGDGVLIERDRPYISPASDPLAAHHTLDVYSPPAGTTSFAGRRKPYPVIVFVHGGRGIASDKNHVNLLMRTLARVGVLAVSVNYRLGADLQQEQAEDVARAFRWVRHNVGSRRYGGDTGNLFVFGHSHGAHLVKTFGSEPTWEAEQRQIRALVLASFCDGQARPTSTIRPSLLLTGTEGLETECELHSKKFSTAAAAMGADVEHVTIVDRDHFTVLSRMALSRDPARRVMLNFMRKHIDSGETTDR